MKWSEVIQSGLFPGAVAGLAGGVVFGGTMSELGLLPTFAQLVRTDSSAVGFIMVMAVAGIVGGGFGTLVCHQRPGVGETLFWGLAYGVFWWYLGPLTLMPLLQGDGLTWDVRSAQAEFPTFLGHVLYGATTGLALVMLQWRRYVESRSLDGIGGAVLRGSMAGLLGAGLLGVMLNAQNQLQAFAAMVDSDSRSVAWLPVLLTGLLAGLAFSVLYPHPAKGDGAGFVRGMVYGIFWWVLGGLTLVPLLSGDGLTWSLEEVRQSSITLPAYLFFGTAVALFYQWLGALVRLLFSDFVGTSGQEGVGTQGLRIVGRSVLGGLVGGLLFSLVMLQTDFLPNVAALVGSTSSVAGFFVHLGIATVIGTSYGLLFRSQSYDIPSALGLGCILRFLLVDPRADDTDADLPGIDSPMDRGGDGRNIPQPYWPPRLWGWVGDHILSAGSPLQPMVGPSYPRAGGPCRPPERASINLGTCFVDYARSRWVSLASSPG